MHSSALAGEIDIFRSVATGKGTFPHEDARQPIIRHSASFERESRSASCLNHQPNASQYDKYTFVYPFTDGTNTRSETLDEAPHRNRCHEAASVSPPTPFSLSHLSFLQFDVGLRGHSCKR